jgi:hypothetical protein
LLTRFGNGLGYLRQKTKALRTLLFILLLSSVSAVAQFPSNYTPTYAEAIAFYERIASDHPTTARLDTIGMTDAGKPLHYLVIDPKGEFAPESVDDNEQAVTLIINGIHPGEACGINASITFVMQKAAEPTPGVVYVIIPIYNVGGALNRNSHTRANQVGPESYGFRGNAKNLDLNRDFVKADSDNALTFSRLFHLWKPHILIDTHTTNGADYQPAMTLLTTFPEKLDPMQATFLKRELEPFLYQKMESLGDEMIPYANFKGKTPEEGINAFLDYPRYSSGYAAMFNCVGFTTEAHMLKEFDRRVEATFNFLTSMDEFLRDKGAMVRKLKSIADKNTREAESFYTKWQIGKATDSLSFPGYEAEYSNSVLSGEAFVEYNRNRPYRRNIPYFNEVKGYYNSVLPKYYVIPQAWENAIVRLKANGVEMIRLEKDTLMDVVSKYTTYYETSDYPYEGHYPHTNVGASERKEKIQFYKGDYLIPTNQIANRYLAVTLDAQSEDSFFSWNFFDPILNQKEYFSSYLFEKTAAEILQRDATLRRSFESKKMKDPAFAKDARAQLKYVYENSAYYEKGHLRIPVFEIR